MWSDYDHDLATRNWQHPTIKDHATGQALMILYANVLADNHDGLVTRGEPVLYPVAKLGPGADLQTAEVVDCADFSRVQKIVVATNTPQAAGPGGWHLVDANLVLKDGLWKVSALAMGTAGSC
jgi:hypothetical protein